MFALTDITRTTQRVICMLLATVFVAASLSIGALGAETASHNGYSVTITQIQ
jgi:ABC-type Fe3+-siderophore transport system permease subunit